jgi:hypothetical protein
MAIPRGTDDCIEAKYLVFLYFMDRAIGNLSDVKLQAEDLLQDITEAPGTADSDPCEEQKRVAPSLKEVLDDGPDRINKACDDISATLEAIRNALL